jgi:hypothetical protein
VFCVLFITVSLGWLAYDKNVAPPWSHTKIHNSMTWHGMALHSLAYLASLGFAFKLDRSLNTAKPRDTNHKDTNKKSGHGNGHKYASVEKLILLENRCIDVIVWCPLFKAGASLRLLRKKPHHIFSHAIMNVFTFLRPSYHFFPLTKGALGTLDVRMTT